ncbi:MAG TPA: efflux RND transporter periplasmic adaptor subunit [Burkholderiales bacterium]|nr:efflux RND transporter periplasmic adaptor subunit [Burkholderiales bacterium]
MKPLNVVLVASALALAACGQQAVAPKAEEIRPVRVMTVGAASAARGFEYAGEVRPRHETRLSFRVGGKITERLVEVGSVVRAGQPVARLDAADLALAVASAKAQVASLQAERDLAAADLKRYTDLRAKNFISQAEYDRRASTLTTAEARLEAVQAQYRQAANQAAYTTLTADTAGVITAIEAEAGQVVTAGQTVAKLARPGEKEIAIAVPESQRDLVEGAKEVAVTLNAQPGRTWKGRLREFSPMADAATRTYAARITVLEAGNDMDLGMSARVSVASAAAASGVELPLSAIYSRGETPNVWLVSGNSVRLVPVKVRGLSGERVLIESGLNSGDVVVIAGASLIREGQPVRVLNAPDKVFAAQ